MACGVHSLTESPCEISIGAHGKVYKTDLDRLGAAGVKVLSGEIMSAVQFAGKI